MVVEAVCGGWFMTGLLVGLGVSLVLGFFYWLVTKALQRQFSVREKVIEGNVIKYLEEHNSNKKK